MLHFKETCPNHPDATLEGYLLNCENLTLGQEQDRPAVIVCPGGGYLYCSSAEGEPVAMEFVSRGFHSFVLTYSTGKTAAGFAPLEEISWAIGLLRENARKWHIHPEKIAVCGFSAGGHLALASGLQAEQKPNAMILGYPAASAPNLPEIDYMLKLLTGKENVTDEDAKRFDLVPQITKDAPPVFLMATAEDGLTALGALPIACQYAKLGLPYELHVVSHGRHGLALGSEVTANGSSRNLNPAFATWIELCALWLHRTFGAPQFVDKSTSRMALYLKEMGISIPGFG